MNVDALVGWVRDHKAVAAAGGLALALGVWWAIHRARSDTTASTTGALTDGGGQYLVPVGGDSTDPGGYATGDGGQLGDVLAALSDLTTVDAGLATGLGDLSDKLGGLTTQLDHLGHDGGHNGGNHGHGGKKGGPGVHGGKSGGPAQGGGTHSPKPTPGGGGNSGHHGHTSTPKHPHDPTTHRRDPRHDKDAPGNRPVEHPYGGTGGTGGTKKPPAQAYKPTGDGKANIDKKHKVATKTPASTGPDENRNRSGRRKAA